MIDIAVREAIDTDLGLILSSWLKSYRNSASQVTVTNDIYYNDVVGQKARILELMAHGSTAVACDPADPDIVYGWACIGRITPPVVNYVYTKQAYRRQCVGSRLLTAMGIAGPVWVTHETFVIREAKKPYTYVPNWRPAV